MEAVEDGVRTFDDETLGVIRLSTQRLRRLAEDISAVSRAEEGTLDIPREPTPAADLARAAAESAGDRFTAAGITLETDLETQAKVLVEPDRIGQVLTNLLDNALRHTASGGTVRIICSLRASWVEYVVSDTGDGIAPEHLDHVFDRFYRSDAARSRAYGGSGIGLSIAKALVEAHGGEIAASSPGPGRGAEFTVRLRAIWTPTARRRAIFVKPSSNPRRNSRQAGQIQHWPPQRLSRLHPTSMRTHARLVPPQPAARRTGRHRHRRADCLFAAIRHPGGAYFRIALSTVPDFGTTRGRAHPDRQTSDAGSRWSPSRHLGVRPHCPRAAGRATAGDMLSIRVDNQLPADTTVHWHGIALRNEADGVPGMTQNPIASGDSYLYEFTAPDPGTYFYHPHVGVQLDRGLYAPLVIDDPREPGDYDLEWILVLDDWVDGTGRTPDGVLAELSADDGSGSDGMRDMGGVHMGGRNIAGVAVRRRRRCRVPPLPGQRSRPYGP